MNVCDDCDLPASQYCEKDSTMICPTCGSVWRAMHYQYLGYVHAWWSLRKAGVRE